MDEAEKIAADVWATARAEDQCARRIPDDELATEVRAAVRRLAAADHIKIRTARMDDSVVVVRLDAAVWHEDNATMRRKLSPS